MLTNEIKVGLAVLLSAVVIFFGVRFLSGQSLLGGGYDVVAVFDDAQGLTPGALVRLNGVRVGDVRAVELGPGARQVFVTMAIDDGVQIPRGSTPRPRTPSTSSSTGSARRWARRASS